MSQEEKNKNQQKKNDTNTSGGYQTTLEEENRKTGVASASDGKTSATPEAPENDTVAGSPNQGTESR
ncbi:hypothetical protein [Calothrix sp. UHCC 0171]|uniref:hypothetical protein n=1 Tax=Calothrix sp. UHCC 0171 TaxID=3110245 RepID=UPI002B1EF237|nr:hypothetical protein [Calothrix sp. UHCC 0171]MEA5571558.1 hypothetical protein [Calothrix sp. UHCC 0171]